MQGIKAQGNVHAWDVVNEAIGWVSEESKWGFKEADPWYPTLTNYVDLAFTYARAADPDTLLFYNDFDVVCTYGKKMAIYNMAKDMQDRGIPIDGIGL
jgi:endo-1,4-beta-xylanase